MSASKRFRGLLRPPTTRAGSRAGWVRTALLVCCAVCQAQPNIDALPQPQTSVPLDLEALAKGYSAQADGMAQAQGLVNGPGLFVFISLSMPPATL